MKMRTTRPTARPGAAVQRFERPESPRQAADLCLARLYAN